MGHLCPKGHQSSRECDTAAPRGEWGASWHPTKEDPRINQCGSCTHPLLFLLPAASTLNGARQPCSFPPAVPCSVGGWGTAATFPWQMARAARTRGPVPQQIGSGCLQSAHKRKDVSPTQLRDKSKARAPPRGAEPLKGGTVGTGPCTDVPRTL